MKFKQISLRNQTKIFLFTLFLITGAISAVLLQTIMFGGLNDLEDNHVKEHAVQVEKSIHEKLDQLQQTAQDYAAWDDGYEYVVDHNKAFETSNLNEITFTNLELDMMVYVDQAGQYVYAKGMDVNNEQLIPIYESLKENLSKSGLLTNTDPDLTIQGIILLDEGPMLIASHPLVHSDYSGPVKGNIIVGRFLDQEEINKIEENLDLQLSLERIDKIHNPKFNELTNSEPIGIDNTGENIIIAYSLLPDIFRQPAVGVIVKMDREFSAIARTTLNSLVVALAIITMLSMLLIDFFFDKKVLSRLRKLSENISHMGNANLNNSSLQYDLKNDEISVVNNAITSRTQELVEANEALANEINLRKRALEKIEQLAYYDALTGLPNRVMLVNRLEQAIDLAKRIEKPLGILFLDLDGFKTVNDTLGHFQGDELLKVVADRLTDLVRQSDTVSRMGGDEFIIVAQNLESADQIHIISDKIIEAFRQPFEINHHEVYVTASIGMSIFPTDGQTHESLIKNADLAMYKAKENGKNQSVLCTAIMKDIITENMKLSNGLYRALERNELEVYYQPQINLKTNKIVSLEALLRWNHPELGMVSPGKFIPLAEQTGLINPIGKWVLQTVCKQNKAWQEAGLPHIRIAVNLSIIQFQSSDIVGQIKDILEETHLLPQYLELEITESIAMRDTDYIVRVLNLFNKMGIYISIDDFGTEFSSLQYLKLLPIDRIKIPMPFIQGINIDEKDEAIIKTIIALAGNMGMDVISEGVETQQQELFLSQQMCYSMQGYYYYKPMPVKEIEVILRTDS